MTTAAPSVRTPGTAGGDSFRVLPGFVDEHLHIEAWLRSQLSVPLASGRLDHPALAGMLRERPPQGEWLVMFGLDHTQLIGDCLAVVETERETPVLVMHRTGHAAVLNAAGSRRLGLGAESRVVYEPRGLWARALGHTPEFVRRRLLERLRATLLAQGVVGVVDATPYRRKDEERVEGLRDALRPVKVSFMGDPLDPVPGCSYLKVVDPRSLPNLLERKPGIKSANVAVHAVEPDEILMALHAARFERLRVEHAAVCPPTVAGQLAERGALVCANPGFLIDRYPAFAGLRASGEAEFLHPVASLLAAGCQVVFGSDAPVSPPGVALSIEAATHRGSAQLPMAGAPVSLAAAFEAARGVGSSHPRDGATETFVVVNTAPGADGHYEMVSTVIDGRVCWPPGSGDGAGQERP
jgi:predicted amidohydrolase YtcJ